MPRARRPIQTNAAPGGRAYGARQETEQAQAAIPLPNEIERQQRIIGMPGASPTPPNGNGDGAAPPETAAAPPPSPVELAQAMPAVTGTFANPPNTPPTGQPPQAGAGFWVQMAVATDDPYWLELAQTVRSGRFSLR